MAGPGSALGPREGLGPGLVGPSTAAGPASGSRSSAPTPALTVPPNDPQGHKRDLGRFRPRPGSLEAPTGSWSPEVEFVPQDLAPWSHLGLR